MTAFIMAMAAQGSAGPGVDSPILYLVGAGGVGAIIAALVQGYFSKRKLGAEATEIITKAAAGVVTNLKDEVERQQQINTDLVREHRADIKTMMLNHAEEIEEMRRVLQLHVAWDAIAIAKMGELGIQLPPAPPLTPARRFPENRLTQD